MPYKTKRGSHYHMTYGCHRATISCGTEGLEPCATCCGARPSADTGATGGAGAAGVAAVGMGHDAPTPGIDAEALAARLGAVTAPVDAATGGEAEEEAQRRREAARRIRSEVSRDFDVSHAAGAIAGSMSRLLGQCDIEELPDGGSDDYTTALVDQYVTFVSATEAELGGSSADYCSSCALRGMRGYRIRLRDTPEADELLHELRVNIHRFGLYPGRSFGILSRAGVPIGRKRRGA